MASQLKAGVGLSQFGVACRGHFAQSLRFIERATTGTECLAQPSFAFRPQTERRGRGITQNVRQALSLLRCPHLVFRRCYLGGVGGRHVILGIASRNRSSSGRKR